MMNLFYYLGLEFIAISTLIYFSAKVFLEDPSPGQAVSIAGIAIPFEIVVGMIPFIGIIIGLWGYYYLIRFAFDTDQFTALLIFTPVLLLKLAIILGPIIWATPA